MFNSIVWATDGSQSSDRALAYVRDLAQAGEGVSITIAHVAETGHSSGAVFMPRPGEELEVVDKLKEVARNLEEEGFNVSLEVRDEARPRPAHDIADIAKAAGGDLIVAGTRGGSAVGMMLGGVTYRLLHIAPCPVLVVPPSD
jgi:nucleotide-binding universal stress UspA family protein